MLEDKKFRAFCNSVGVIVLAAGESRRLGRPKQLVKINAETLLQRSVRSALESGLHQIIVVLGSNAAIISESFKDLPVEICLNDNWSSGMSTTIRSGINAMENLFPGVSHVLILLSDQPFVSKTLISQLLATCRHSDKEIIASKYKNSIGVPAIFPKQYFHSLKNLTGDKGARKLLLEYEGMVKAIDFEEGKYDIDTLSDLEEIQKMLDENKENFSD